MPGPSFVQIQNIYFVPEFSMGAGAAQWIHSFVHLGKPPLPLRTPSGEPPCHSEAGGFP